MAPAIRSAYSRAALAFFRQHPTPEQQKPLPKERLLKRSAERELLGDALEEDRELVELDVPALTVLLETVTTVASTAGKSVEA